MAGGFGNNILASAELYDPRTRLLEIDKYLHARYCLGGHNDTPEEEIGDAVERVPTCRQRRPVSLPRRRPFFAEQFAAQAGDSLLLRPCRAEINGQGRRVRAAGT